MFTCLLTVFGSAEDQAETLFTLSDLKGQSVMYADAKEFAGGPKFMDNKAGNDMFLQSKKGANGTTYHIVHNAGSSEILYLDSGGSNSMQFVEMHEGEVGTYTICFDRKFKDGSYMVLYSSVKANKMGLTVGTLFWGKATPSLRVRQMLAVEEALIDESKLKLPQK